MIRRCGETGLLLLPGGSDPAITRYLASWETLEPQRFALILPLVKGQQAEDRLSRCKPRRLIETTLGLLPLPENDYDCRATAVVVPDPGTGALDASRQVAWIKQDHLRSLHPSITGLMSGTGEPVGFRAVVEVDAYFGREEYDCDEESDGDWSDESVLTEREAQELRYEFGGLRARIGPWAEVRQAVLDYVRPLNAHSIVPVASHRAQLSEGAKALRDGDLHGRPIEVDLVADAGRLVAMLDGLELAQLFPASRDFFWATYQQVIGRGGSQRAQAVLHEGSLEVFVEESPRGPDVN